LNGERQQLPHSGHPAPGGRHLAGKASALIDVIFDAGAMDVKGIEEAEFQPRADRSLRRPVI
jgi:hypothetical protein